MSLFHAAAQPKVQLRKRAEHMLAYLRSRFYKPTAVRNCIDTMADVVDVLEDNPDATTIEYARLTVYEAEEVFEEALTWRNPRDSDNLAMGITAVWGALMLCVSWLSWKYEPPAPTMFALPIIVLDPDDLLGLKNANAA